MQLDRQVCDRARRSRDPRFDGRFFIAVTSTGIYCRPICPARSPKDENIRYYPTAAAAESAGFRPCLRCRPEASPGTPAWLGTSSLVSRALRLIGDGALRGTGELENGDVDHLADRLGVTARHLRRLFVQHLGATPLEVALTRRVHFAKKLLDETTLPFHQVANAAGFGSLRRFNSQIRRTYSRTPTELRRLAKKRDASAPDCYRFKLAYRPPYDWNAILAFLAARATPGVEAVVDGRYRRTISVDGKGGWIEVSRLDSSAALGLDVRFPDPRGLLFIVEQVRRIFDLGADPAVIGEHLSVDLQLRRVIAKHPGLRAPGAWDGFELAVRAILGQQVSVRAATTIAGRIASMFGTETGRDRQEGREATEGQLNRLFPTPAQLADAPIEQAGVVSTRATAIRSLARRVMDGSISFGTCADASGAVTTLQALPGIGAWTAQYIAMRALGEPDAFPTGDLVLRRMTAERTPRGLERRAEAWRPWRAYAVMLLWQAAVDAVDSVREEQSAQSKRRSDAQLQRSRTLHARHRVSVAGFVDRRAG